MGWNVRKFGTDIQPPLGLVITTLVQSDAVSSHSLLQMPRSLVSLSLARNLLNVPEKETQCRISMRFFLFAFLLQLDSSFSIIYCRIFPHMSYFSTASLHILPHCTKRRENGSIVIHLTRMTVNTTMPSATIVSQWTMGQQEPTKLCYSAACLTEQTECSLL